MAATMADDYTPRGQTAEILDRAYKFAQSVVYQVSARWDGGDA